MEKLVWEKLGEFSGGNKAGKRKVRGKRYSKLLFEKLPSIESALGGLVESSDGKLKYKEGISRADYDVLMTSRESRLVRDDDDFVIGLRELPKIISGNFYNVQELSDEKPFIRDWLVEPVNTAVDVLVYKRDVVLKSRAFKEKRALHTGNIKEQIRRFPILQTDYRFKDKYFIRMSSDVESKGLNEGLEFIGTWGKAKGKRARFVYLPLNGNPCFFQYPVGDDSYLKYRLPSGKIAHSDYLNREPNATCQFVTEFFAKKTKNKRRSRLQKLKKMVTESRLERAHMDFIDWVVAPHAESEKISLMESAKIFSSEWMKKKNSIELEADRDMNVDTKKSALLESWMIEELGKLGHAITDIESELQASDKEFDIDSMGEGEVNLGDIFKAKPSKRGAIEDFTRNSRERLKFVLRNSLCQFSTFVTLTYPADYPRDGKECKRHLNLFLTHLRKDYEGIQYVWFMEFQERGAPHFHLFTSCPLPGKTYVNQLWYGIVSSKDVKHQVSGTQVKALKNEEQAISYAIKYANKLSQKARPEDFVNVGRFWGTSRCLCDPIVELSDISIYELQRMRRQYLKSLDVDGRTDKMNGYLWNYTSEAPRFCHEYYKLHLQALVGELLEQGAVRGSAKGLEVIRELKQSVLKKGRLWRDLTKSEAEAYYRDGIEALPHDGYNYVDSEQYARSLLTSQDYEDAEVSVSDFTDYLNYLHARKLVSYEEREQPLYKPEIHVYIYYSRVTEGVMIKRRYEPHLNKKGEPRALRKCDIEFLQSLDESNDKVITLEDFLKNERLRERRKERLNS